ncbi:MAG: MBL fold metallo-hydrolase [Deltaproteobacteria bacterium]|nr:MBL fold metallo-hydrolase [Deltaproteobacteria bacterium]
MLKITHYNPVTRFDLARTVAGRGRYWTAAYYVDGLLIDSGCAHTAHEFVNALNGKPLSCIVNTHSHEDHVGANHLLQKNIHGLEIRTHPLAIPILADPRNTQPLQPYRKIMWGWPDASQTKPIQDGDVIRTAHYRFQAIYTPGHSPDHICLYESSQGWLFTGDLYVGGKDRALRKDYEIWQIIASLKKIVTLPFNSLFPASARIPDKPKEDMQDKIIYLESMGEQALVLHQKGWKEKDIAKKLFGAPMPIEWITLGHFSRRHLVRSYLRL